MINVIMALTKEGAFNMIIKNGKRLFFILICAVFTIISGCGNNNKNNTESEMYTETEGVKDNTQVAEYETTETQAESIGETMREDGSEIDTEVSEEAFTFEDITQEMYTTASINVRSLPSIDGEKIGGMLVNEKVQITGRCKETGWYRIEYNGGIGYVSADYITDKLPSSWVAELGVAQNVSQIIVVTADETKDVDVTVSMHTKDENGIWNENYSTSGKIGRNGLGKEKEGDGKTPIGIFTFTRAFGILPNPGIISMPYLQVDETHHWVDDPESKYYNQCVSTKDVEPDWNSTEHLCKIVGEYNYSLATNYNEECTPYAGCAIFLHCIGAEIKPTSGCIAIPEEYMVKTMILLRRDCVIVIDTAEKIYSY